MRLTKKDNKIRAPRRNLRAFHPGSKDVSGSVDVSRLIRAADSLPSKPFSRALGGENAMGADAARCGVSTGSSNSVCRADS